MKITAAYVRSSLVMAALCLGPLARAEDLTTKFQQYMDAAVKVDGFSGSVLVSRGGETLFARGYGLANIELGVPNTPRTKFRIGSITKQFTAMAVMVLAEQGKLELDDPIGKYVEDAPKTWEKVTIHHLLTHTSGVFDFSSAPDFEKLMAQPDTVPSLIARFRDRPLDFPPGEKCVHSNSGYILLGAVIEKASRMSYEAFLNEAIFGPLGLRDTGYDHSETILPNRAAGYERAGYELQNAPYHHMSQPYAAGALYSTVEAGPAGQGLERREADLEGVVHPDVHAGQGRVRLRLGSADGVGAEGDQPRRRDLRFPEPDQSISRSAGLRGRTQQRAPLPDDGGVPRPGRHHLRR